MAKDFPVLNSIRARMISAFKAKTAEQQTTYLQTHPWMSVLLQNHDYKHVVDSNVIGLPVNIEQLGE